MAGTCLQRQLMRHAHRNNASRFFAGASKHTGISEQSPSESLRNAKPETMQNVAGTILGENWAPERLGHHLVNPLIVHGLKVAHTPGTVKSQKHTFEIEYFRSKECKNLLKVAYEGAVTLSQDQGYHVAVARRAIRAGEIVERGILRGFDPESLDDKAPNQAIFRLGQDFMTSAGFPWSDYSQRPGPPFLPSGLLKFYKVGIRQYNVELMSKDSHVEGFEVDVVATEDIPEGTPLVRKISRQVQKANTRYADVYQLSESDINDFISHLKELDVTLAAKAGVEPDQIHEDAIREHAHLTAVGAAPIVNCSRSVTLPHPTWGGFGVFASDPIRAGEIIESGLMVEVNGLTGDKCPYVFTWNKGGQRHTDGTPNNWCTGSGNAMFYNSDRPANARMYRFRDQFRYLIVAKEDIKEGEEIMHLYASSSWRKCFVEDDCLPKVLPVETTSD